MDHPNGITIKRVEKDRIGELCQWASRFGHSVSGEWPTYEVVKKGKRLAYFELPNIPVIYPGISPESSKREVLECCKTVVETVKSQFGACQAVTPDETLFTPEIMAHFGFNVTHQKLYTAS